MAHMQSAFNRAAGIPWPVYIRVPIHRTLSAPRVRTRRTGVLGQQQGTLGFSDHLFFHIVSTACSGCAHSCDTNALCRSVHWCRACCVLGASRISLRGLLCNICGRLTGLEAVLCLFVRCRVIAVFGH
jgi:hypothetical protein